MNKEEHDKAVHDLCIAPAEFRLRKITDAAHARMLARAAKERLAHDMADANRGPDEAIPDADDESAQRYRVLT